MERGNLLQNSEGGPTAPIKTPITSCSCKRGNDGQFSRNLVVCIDGTANKFGMQNTNVVELYSRLVKDETQLTYYNSGIGTHATRRSNSSFWDTMLEMAIGSNIEANVLDAYEWLSENYKSGDRIFLFGFSRGAYQVRIIAGMIEKVGLLHKGNKQQIPFAYDLYIRIKTEQKQQESANEKIAIDNEEGSKLQTLINQVGHRKGSSSSEANSSVKRATKSSYFKGQKSGADSRDSGPGNDERKQSDELCQNFKRALSHIEVKVHFVGCWDTVSSVGLVRRDSLPETTTGMAHVCAFRHALALDELRVKFLPEYVNGGAGPRLEKLSAAGGPTEASGEQIGPVRDHKTGDVKEVWFAGCHSDIGGGNVENLKANKFGPALRWMTYESITWGLRTTPFDQSWEVVLPQSSMTTLWKVLEYTIPFKRLSYKGPNHITRRLHRASPRQIFPGQLLHESVFEHITPFESKSGPDAKVGQRPYKPLALLPEDPSVLPADKRLWDMETLHSHCLIEKDPYKKPSQILDRIKEKTKLSDADFDALFAASFIEIGLRAIRERQDAEDVLISALETEVQPEGSKQRIPIIAKILDRCFDLVPKSSPTVNSTVWKDLDKLYETMPTTRSKFLRRFADEQVRKKTAQEDIKQATKTLTDTSNEFVDSVAQIDAIATMAMAILDLFIMKSGPETEQMLPHRRWIYDTYRKFITFRDLSQAGRCNVIVNFLSDAQTYGQQYPEAGDNYLDERVLLLKHVQKSVSAKDNQQATLAETENRSRYLDVLFRHAYELHVRVTNGTQPTSNAIDDVISLYRHHTELQPPLHRDEDVILNNLIFALHTRFERYGKEDDLGECISFYRGAVELRPVPHPARSMSLNQLGAALFARFQRGGDAGNLKESISLHREALELRPPPHPERAWSLNNLGLALYIRFLDQGLGGQPSDLTECISLHREALELRLSPHPDRSWTLYFLGLALFAQFEKGGNASDLEESISFHKDALELRPAPHFYRYSSLHQLGAALLTRFQRGGAPSNLDECVSLHREAVELRPAHPPHPERPIALNDLARILCIRFDQGGNPKDLEEGISFYRQALELRPAPHPDRVLSLTNLGVALLTQFFRVREPSHLDECVSLHRQALELRPAPHSDRASSLSDLGNMLRIQFQQGGEQRDLDESISLQRQALELPPGPHRHSVLNYFGITFLARFERGGKPSDLEESISLHRKALELQPDGQSNRPFVFSSLGRALFTRFMQGSVSTDLEESFHLFGQALELRPASDLARSWSLSDLGTVLLTRFERLGEPIDLEKSISLFRQSLELRPTLHPDRSWSLSNLGFALLIQFKYRGNQTSLEESISLHRQAHELQPGPHPHRSWLLSNLGDALRSCFQQGGEAKDLGECLFLHRQALELQPAPHINRSWFLNDLGKTLHIKSMKGGDPADVEESILLHRQALELQPISHHYRPIFLSNLGSALFTRFNQRGEPNDLEESISLYRKALDLQPPHHIDRPEVLGGLAAVLEAQRRGISTKLSPSASVLESFVVHPLVDRILSLVNPRMN